MNNNLSINPFEVLNERLNTIETLLTDIKQKPADIVAPISKKLHSIRALAEFLDTSITTAQKYKNEGCPCIQYGRKVIFDTDEVLLWLSKKSKK